MKKYKKTLCALLVTTSVFGTSQIIFASTNKENKMNSVSQSKVGISDEVLFPEESIVTRKAMYAKNVAAAKVEETAKLAAKAEEARLAAKAEKAKKAAEAEKAKLAAAKAKKVAAAKTKKVAGTTIKKTAKIVASRGTSAAPVSSEKAQEIIAYAKKFMGVKYVFGGESPSGFDCSGFTMYVFKKFGIDLPHSARSQAGLGLAVSKSDLIPGDLVFFHTYTSGISHVGIYVGNNNFIEASSSRGIAVTSLSSSYYSTRYIGATRILK
jgi:cell wall-associated NlpC family hydrolase